MSDREKRDFELERPSCMLELGVLPPYELSDIKAAYHAKARICHPDRGGQPAEFIHLKEAYDQAIEYCNCHGSRRMWVGAQVEQYLRQQTVIEEVLRRGGRVEIEQLRWIEKSLGEGFSYLAERLRHIYVRNMSDGDDFLKFLSAQQPSYLVGLDVSGSRVSDAGLRCLANFEVLRWLDLSRMNLRHTDVLSLLEQLPSLDRINLRKTRLGWWGRWRLRRARSCRILSEPSSNIDSGSVTIDFLDSTWRA